MRQQAEESGWMVWVRCDAVVEVAIDVDVSVMAVSVRPDVAEG